MMGCPYDLQTEVLVFIYHALKRCQVHRVYQKVKTMETTQIGATQAYAELLMEEAENLMKKKDKKMKKAKDLMKHAESLMKRHKSNEHNRK
jgi:hypothetical protein